MNMKYMHFIAPSNVIQSNFDNIHPPVQSVPNGPDIWEIHKIVFSHSIKVLLKLSFIASTYIKQATPKRRIEIPKNINT